MNIRMTRTAVALLTVLLLPITAMGATSAPMHMQRHHKMPPFAAAMRAAHLTVTQRAQIRTLRQQFRAQRTPGTHPTRAQFHALRSSILGVLTPAQRSTVRQRMQAIKAARRAQRAQRNPQAPGAKNNPFTPVAPSAPPLS